MVTLWLVVERDINTERCRIQERRCTDDSIAGYDWEIPGQSVSLIVPYHRDLYTYPPHPHPPLSLLISLPAPLSLPPPPSPSLLLPLPLLLPPTYLSHILPVLPSSSLRKSHRPMAVFSTTILSVVVKKRKKTFISHVYWLPTNFCMLFQTNRSISIKTQIKLNKI